MIAKYIKKVSLTPTFYNASYLTPYDLTTHVLYKNAQSYGKHILHPFMRSYSA